MTEDELTLVEDCLNFDHGLTNKEIEFLEDLFIRHEKQGELGLHYDLSDKQRKWLSDIGNRLGIGGLV